MNIASADSLRNVAVIRHYLQANLGKSLDWTEARPSKPPALLEDTKVARGLIRLCRYR